MYLTKFTVRGSGRFPIDMLRYDQAFPYTEEDTSWIERSDTRELMLGIIHSNKTNGHVTRARWASFGWTVTEVYPTRKVAG